MKIVIALSFACALVPDCAAAQRQGTVTEERTITPSSRGAVDTLLTRNFSLGTKSRTEYVSATRGTLPGMKPGVAIINDGNDSDMVMIYVDSTRKLYAEMHPMKLFSGMADMGTFKMRMDSTDDSASVDSIGPGPVIAGYRTIHFRTRSTSKTVFGMMGDSSVRTEVTVSDVYLAPDLASPERNASSTQRRAAMKKLLPRDIGAMAERFVNIQKRLAPYGPALRTDSEVSSSSTVGTTVHRTSTETLSYRKEAIPASLFVVPPGYKKVALMDLLMPD